MTGALNLWNWELWLAMRFAAYTLWMTQEILTPRRDSRLKIVPDDHDDGTKVGYKGCSVTVLPYLTSCTNWQAEGEALTSPSPICCCCISVGAYSEKIHKTSHRRSLRRYANKLSRLRLSRLEQDRHFERLSHKIIPHRTSYSFITCIYWYPMYILTSGFRFQHRPYCGDS